MLGKAKEYLNRLKMLKGRTESKSDQDYVQLHINIMEYLVDCAEKVESHTIDLETEWPDRPEVSK